MIFLKALHKVLVRGSLVLTSVDCLAQHCVPLQQMKLCPNADFPEYVGRAPRRDHPHLLLARQRRVRAIRQRTQQWESRELFPHITWIYNAVVTFNRLAARAFMFSHDNPNDTQKRCSKLPVHCRQHPCSKTNASSSRTLWALPMLTEWGRQSIRYCIIGRSFLSRSQLSICGWIFHRRQKHAAEVHEISERAGGG